MNVGAVNKLRKLIPAEVLIAWVIMKEGFNTGSDSSDCPGLFSKSLMVAVTIVWSILLVVCCLFLNSLVLITAL